MGYQIPLLPALLESSQIVIYVWQISDLNIFIYQSSLVYFIPHHD